jgi:hypothetical protein
LSKYFRIVFFFFCFVFFPGGNFNLFGQSIFFEKYPEAKNTVTETYSRLSILQELPKEKGKIIYSIVAPEVAMYKSFLNLMETGAAEIFYVNMGGEYGNFSLGIFQMKPSFIEKIEGDYKKYCKRGEYLNRLRYAHDLNMDEIRGERIVRLKLEEWQQIYLICFYEILEVKYANKFPDLREKISFYAAAYNYGFQSNYDEIKRWEKKISFPGRTEKSIVSYSKLAVEFLELMVENIPRYVPAKETNSQTEKVSLINSTDLIIEKKEGKVKEEVKRSDRESEANQKKGFDFRWLFLLFILPIALYIRVKKK